MGRAVDGLTKAEYHILISRFSDHQLFTSRGKDDCKPGEGRRFFSEEDQDTTEDSRADNIRMSWATDDKRRIQQDASRFG